MSTSENINPELSENDHEYETAYNEFMERRNTIWNPMFEEAEKFHQERKERAAKRKAEESNPQLKAQKEKEAKETEREFDEKERAYRTAMEQFIPLGDTYFAGLESGRSRIQVHRNMDNGVATRASNGVSNTGARSGHTREQAPDTTRQLTAQEIPTDSNAEAMESLEPIPIRRYSYQDSQRGSVASAPPSIRTGAQIRVNRVPTEQIPRSEGLSEYGLHPHATAWTRAPVWAQAIVAIGIGTALGGLGFGIFKLIGKLVNRNGAASRLHARDWKKKQKRRVLYVE